MRYNGEEFPHQGLQFWARSISSVTVKPRGGQMNRYQAGPGKISGRAESCLTSKNEKFN